MFAVFADYPSGAKILVGYAHSKNDVDGLIEDCIRTNGKDALEVAGIHLVVEELSLTRTW